MSNINRLSTSANKELEVPEGLTYEAYLQDWQAHLARPMAALDRKERKYQYYAKYNWERSERVADELELSDTTRRELAEITEPQKWLVITEDWCADSAYSLPVIRAMVEAAPAAELRILRRDEHLNVMDRYLTNGSRSIPKLVVFSSDREELLEWGPRPEALRLLREKLATGGDTGAAISSATLNWYEQGGWREVEAELSQLLLPANSVKKAA